ncbi:MAG: hypothetical protein HY598_01075 [Candidatus Omnitrophica bacterium]|nr:hypothetical protein [Candidatus Omnitrophota bacterium]
MKRISGWALVGCAVVCWTLAAEAAKEPKGAAKAPPAAAPAAPTEKIAYTFSDDAKVEEFARLWQQRQAAIVRMTVLRSYFQEEQAALEQLNQRFTKDYNLDVSKNYRFDSEHKKIIELQEPAPPQPQVSQAPPAAQPAQASP